ncbi:hypothetical protein ABW19_dt0209066 [Dactylella cylindrospora]|nr:hypothetical protein ABW19_dt0209066 [Dactylella cylindrospora]
MSLEQETSKPTPQAELYKYYSSTDKKALSSLPAEELETVTSAIKKILASPAAEDSIPNLIEGPSLDPSERAWTIDLSPPPAPSKNTITKYTKAVAALDLPALEISSKVLEEYESAPASSAYKQHRLLEIVLTAIHHIAIDLYKTNFPPPDASEALKEFIPPPYPAIAHNQYYASKPWKSIIDLKSVGFWAEAQIFGGVVYFDRGYSSNPTGEEYEGVWLHGLPGAYTDSLWHVPDDIVSKALDEAELPFDVATAKDAQLLGLQEAQEAHLIYRDPFLANQDAYTGEHADETIGLSDEDLAEIMALKKAAEE